MDPIYALAIAVTITIAVVGSIALLGLAIVSLIINRTVDNADFISDIEE
jgi:hypothetical protein